MSVKIMVGGQMKVVADVISPGVITRISSLSYIYSGSAWLECDGSAISRTTYADLYAAIGTTYGSGDGVNTFNIPTQAQAIRVSYSVASDTTFSQFTSDADIVVNNPSAAYIDISNGAAGPGLHISIVEQSAQGVTVYMDAGHTLSFTLAKGVVTLVWNGSAWQYVAGAALRWVFTSGTSQTWKAPWTGVFVVAAQGGGGKGGNASGGGNSGSPDYSDYPGSKAGGGGGGGTATRKYSLVAGQSCTYSVGGSGQASSFADGTVTITGSAGAAGANSSSGGGGSGGAGGGASGGDTNHVGSGGSPGSNGSLVTGTGGGSMYGGGAAGRLLSSGTTSGGAAGGAYGGGGEGASRAGGGSSGTTTGANGASGLVLIEVAA